MLNRYTVGAMALGMVVSTALAAPPPGGVIRTVSTLQAGDSAAQSVARAQLIAIAGSPRMQPTYPATLNAALLPVFTSSASTRAKLNAAIVLEGVAARTASPALLPATSAALSDNSEAVALWGVKAARSLIAAGGAPAATLSAQVAATAKAHPQSAPIVEEAYAALMPDAPPAATVVQSLLTVLEMRIADYANGAAPPDPGAEQAVPAYLAVTCWPKATAAEQKRISTDLANLALATSRAVSNGDTDRTVLAIARFAGAGIESIGTQLHDDALTAAAKSMQEIQPGQTNAISTACKALDAALTARGIVLQSSVQ